MKGYGPHTEIPIRNDIVDKLDKLATAQAAKMDILIVKLGDAVRKVALMENTNRKLSKENARMRRIIEGVFDPEREDNDTLSPEHAE
jgi:hypothetical protein